MSDIYNENQFVKVKWANKTRKHYESKGYIFTGYGEWFEAKAKDLPKQSKYEIMITCDYCGKDFKTTKANREIHVDKTKDACPKCHAYKQHSYTKNNRAKDAFNLLKDFCSDMNYELVTKESDYTNAKMDIQCSARISKGAKRIEDFLISQDIVFEKEKAFDDCKDKNRLPFDFYLPSFNTIIEFDGEQHFRLVPAWGERSFELTQRHDRIKDDFCKSHHISLIRIPYNEFNNIESILLEKLNIKIKQIS